MAGFRRLGTRRVARSSFLVLERDHVLAGDGRWIVRATVRHRGSVVVIPWDGDAVFMVRQYRHAAGRPILELPAGKLDVAGEPPEDAARRECIEEVGMEPGALRRVHGCYLSPGFTDEYSHVFLADRLRPVSAAPQGVEEEAADIVRLTRDEVAEGLRRSRFEDAKTIVGLYALLDHLGP